jgi:transposase
MGGHGFSPRFCPEASVIGRALSSTRDLEAGRMKNRRKAMEILEAYDLTGSLRRAAVLAGCDHKTVARLVAAREAAGGGLPERERRRPLVDPFAGKIEELVDRSRGRIGADRAHSKLVATGYQGSERTTRRAVAEAKRRWRQKHGRRTRPWIPEPEPGLWLQWDYGDDPVVTGARTVLFCASLGWSRYRVVVPLRDTTLASVVIGLDRTLRRFDGVPTYALTDNEKTVTVEHMCGIAVRNPTVVEVSRHYGLTIATCEPADPQSLIVDCQFTFRVCPKQTVCGNLGSRCGCSCSAASISNVGRRVCGRRDLLGPARAGRRAGVGQD